MQETWVWSLGWEDLLEEEKATHSSILAWRIPWTVQSVGSQRVRHDWATFTFSNLEMRSLRTLKMWNELSGHSQWLEDMWVDTSSGLLTPRPVMRTCRSSRQVKLSYDKWHLQRLRVERNTSLGIVKWGSSVVEKEERTGREQEAQWNKRFWTLSPLSLSFSHSHV